MGFVWPLASACSLVAGCPSLSARGLFQNHCKTSLSTQHPADCGRHETRHLYTSWRHKVGFKCRKRLRISETTIPVHLIANEWSLVKRAIRESVRAVPLILVRLKLTLRTRRCYDSQQPQLHTLCRALARCRWATPHN